MPVHADDRLLWIIVGSGLLLAANAIPYYLRYIRTLTEVIHEEIPSKECREDAEDALKLSTLQKLAAGPSYRLRASAIKIIAERSIREGTRKRLLQDLAGKNAAKRKQALHALWFLLSDASLKTDPEIIQHFISDTSTFAALVSCLANLLALHENGPPVRADNPTAASPLLPRNRPPSETLALLLLHKLLTDHTTSNALSAGLISKWLAHYPFPCALPENGNRRQDVVKLFKTWGQDDPLMESIMTTLRKHPDGLKQLRRHGLTGSSYREAEVDDAGIQDVFMTDADDTAGLPPAASSSSSSSSSSSAIAPPASSPPAWSRRPPDPSSNQAERAVRQRRREAAVYSEGDAPLTQDNIFQRQPSNPGPGPATGSPELEAERTRRNEELQREEDDLAEAVEEVREASSRRASAGRTVGGLSALWRWLGLNTYLARLR